MAVLVDLSQLSGVGSKYGIPVVLYGDSRSTGEVGCAVAGRYGVQSVGV